MNGNSALSISSRHHHRMLSLSPSTSVTLTKKPPGSIRTSRYNNTPSTDSHLQPTRSHLGLLTDRRLSVSSQRRRTFLHRPGSRILAAPCFFYLLFSSLLSLADSAVIPSGTITLSRSLNAPYKKSLDLNTTSSVLDEFPGIELSGDLDLPLNDAESVQDEDFFESDDQGHYINLEPIDYQKETAVVQGYSRTVKHEEFIKGRSALPYSARSVFHRFQHLFNAQNI